MHTNAGSSGALQSSPEAAATATLAAAAAALALAAAAALAAWLFSPVPQPADRMCGSQLAATLPGEQQHACGTDSC